IGFFPETPQWNAAPKRCRRKAGPHVAERRRRRDRARRAETGIGDLVAVERDAIAAQQPVRVLALALSEELEIKVPNPLGRHHQTVRPLLAVERRLKAWRRRLFESADDRAVHLFCDLQKIAP